MSLIIGSHGSDWNIVEQWEPNFMMNRRNCHLRPTWARQAGVERQANKHRIGFSQHVIGFLAGLPLFFSRAGQDLVTSRKIQVELNGINKMRNAEISDASVQLEKILRWIKGGGEAKEPGPGACPPD